MEWFEVFYNIYLPFEVAITEFITQNASASIKNPTTEIESKTVLYNQKFWGDKDDKTFQSDSDKNRLSEIRKGNSNPTQTNNQNTLKPKSIKGLTGNIPDKHIWKSTSNNKIYNKITISKGMEVEIPIYAKTKDNYNLFKFIEDKFSTRLSKEKINFIKQYYPTLSKVEFIDGFNINYYKRMPFSLANKVFINKLNHLSSYGYIEIPQGISKENYIMNIKITAKILYEEYKLREGYLRNPQDSKSQQYITNLLISDKSKHFINYLKVDNPEVNKSRLLTALHEDKYNVKDFSSYNWNNQVKIYFWSLHRGIHNDNSIQSGYNYDFDTMYKDFHEIKNQELVILSQNPEKLSAPKRIGVYNKNHVRPQTYLVGLMYDDALNSARLKSSAILSQVYK